MTNVFWFRVADRPEQWLTMIDPARPTLDEARASLEQRFGAARVLEVREG